MEDKNKLISNFFPVKLNSQIYKYNLNLQKGNVQQLYTEIKETLFRNKDNRELITKNLGKHFVFLNNAFYSTKMMITPLAFELKEDKVSLIL